MSRSRGKSACGMARHIGEPKRKRKLQARRLAASLLPGVQRRERTIVVVILSYARSKARVRDRSGRAGQIPVALIEANVFDVFRVRLAAPKRRIFVSRQAEFAHVERHCVRRAAGSAEPMGPRCVRGNSRGPDRDRPQLSRHFRAPARAERNGGVARLLAIALLRAAHDAAHVRGARRLARLHLHLRHARGQEPAGGDGADPGARHPAVGADFGVFVLHGDVLPRALSRKYLRRGAGGDLCDLHQPSLEHGLFFLPVAADRAARSRRGGARLPPDRLAEVLAARGALRDAWPHLEHDDVDVGRLVLRGRLGSHHGRRHDDHAPGGRFIYRQGERRRGLVGDRRGGSDNGNRHPALRSALVPSDCRLGGQVSRRTFGQSGRRDLVGAERHQTHPLAASGRHAGLRRAQERRPVAGAFSDHHAGAKSVGRAIAAPRRHLDPHHHRRRRVGARG